MSKSTFIWINRATRQIGAIANESNGAAAQALPQQGWETVEVRAGYTVPRMTEVLPEGWKPSSIPVQQEEM